MTLNVFVSVPITSKRAPPIVRVVPTGYSLFTLSLLVLMKWENFSRFFWKVSSAHELPPPARAMVERVVQLVRPLRPGVSATGIKDPRSHRGALGKVASPNAQGSHRELVVSGHQLKSIEQPLVRAQFSFSK